MMDARIQSEETAASTVNASLQETLCLAEDVKRQLPDLDLSGNLLEPISSLLEQLENHASLIEHEQAGEGAKAKGNLNAADMLDSLEGNFSRWQAELTTAFEVGASDELRDQIDRLQNLESTYERRLKRLEKSKGELEERLTLALKREIRIDRQRKSIAKELKVKLAELRQAQAEFQQEKAEWRTEHAQQEFDSSQWETKVSTLEDELGAKAKEYDELEQRLIDCQQQLEAIQQELEEERAESKNVSPDPKIEEQRAAIELLEEENEAMRETLRVAQETEAEAKQEVESTRQELDTLRSEVESAREEAEQAKQDAEQASQKAEQANQIAEDAERARVEAEKAREDAEHASAGSDSSNEEIEDLRCELELITKQLREANSQIEQLEEAAEEAQEHGGSDGEEANELRRQLERITRELDANKEELQDLQNQNSDLAAQVAKHQASSSDDAVNLNQESLSWEERKQLIMKQLESECEEADGESAADARNKKVEVEDILATTENEIQKREREIEGLQAIIEQQADAHQGVAIGATAIAEMLDSDELIQQEREKLKHIQAEWEEKLRQAEIDLSMERAKLARERTELEMAKATVQLPDTSEPTEGSEGKEKTRKWLEHLGLNNQE